MENYIEYQLMGSVSHVRMKPGCMPTKFQCQSDRRKQHSYDIEQPNNLIKQRKTLIEECEDDSEENTLTTKHVELTVTSPESSAPKMADDIDIEEHDVMDDPKIKLIFPDLTKLKKEIFDEGPKEQQMQEIPNEHSLHLSNILLKSQATQLQLLNNCEDIVEIPQISSKPLPEVSDNILFFRNKIILGSKPNSEDEKLNQKVKIVVKSIDVYLEKSKRYCNICLTLFASKQNFEEHIKVCHSPHQVNFETINELKSHNEKTKNENDVPEKCFHCNIRFLTQKSLIDHLYDVLESKNAEIKPKNVNVNDEACNSTKNAIQIQSSSDNNAKINNSVNISCTEATYVYQCQVCSYYFNQVKFYEAHILKKHQMKKPVHLSKVKFNCKCRFCSYQYTSIQYYNTHLLKRHRDIVYQKVLSNKKYKKENICISKHLNKDIDSETNLLNKSENNDQHPRNYTFTSDSRTNVLMLKSIVFKCSTCHIHFLSSAVAINHVEHSQILINWKCSICSKIFKRNDEELHIKQHQCSTSFTIHELRNTDLDKVLFKCSMCAVHFMEEDILRHMSSCEEESVRSTYCSTCDILLDFKIKLSHDKSHSVKNMNSADYIVVTSNKSTTSHEKSSDYSKKIIQPEMKYIKKVCGIDTKPDHVKSTKKPDNNFNDNSDTDTGVTTASGSNKRSKNDEMDIDSNFNSDSDLNSIMDVDDDSDDSDFKTYSSPSKCKVKDKNSMSDTFTSDSDTDPCTDTDSLKRSKKKCKIVGKFDTGPLSNRFSYKNKNQLQLLNLTYCKFCECFVSRTYKLNVHLESLCTQILKRVCTYCGLTITAKCSTSHKAFHKLNPHLKLQDFKFYDIKTNKIMCPPIPILPKCDICNTCFTSKVDIIGHICTEDYMQCSICNIKLSEVAFKLHVPFHKYSLKMKNNETDFAEGKTLKENETDFNLDKNSKQIPNGTEENISSLHKSNSASNCNVFLKLVFVCKSCNLSVNTYDNLIEHCHSHYINVQRNVNTEMCKICNLEFESDAYKYHEELHSNSNKDDFRIISIDVFYFGSSNEDWLKHVFKSLSKEEKDDILQKSIYNFECKIKMRIKQPGPWNLTIYLCDKCRCFLDNMSIFKHVASCNGKFYKNPCIYCGICFVSSLARIEHEQNVHKLPGVTLKSYRIVIFNSKEDKIVNDAITNIYNRYVLYKCRNCSGVENENHQNHKCQVEDLKKCTECGLLLNEKDYKQHVSKHKALDSFVENNMKVILFGRKSDEQKQRSDIVCSFSGIVYDYTFYKCVKCEVCIRYLRPCSKHFCLIDAAKLKCSKCQLYFDEGKMKGHLKLHSGDPDFCRDNMMIVDFNPEETLDREDLKSKNAKGDLNNSERLVKHDNNIKLSVKNNIATKTDTIYKCPCGLHHLTKSGLHGRQKCDIKKKNLHQTCSKCGLAFTPNVLFKHILKHHGDKSVLYKLDIIEV